MFKVSKFEKFKRGMRNFWINLCDRGILEASKIFYNNFFKNQTHKFETQTPYGDWQSTGDRIRYVINNEFLNFIENQAFPRWSQEEREMNPKNVLEEFDNQIKHYKESGMGGNHIISVKEAKEAYRILRKDIPNLKEKKRETDSWEKWADLDDKIIRKKYESSEIISRHLDWIWI